MVYLLVKLSEEGIEKIKFITKEPLAYLKGIVL
jgi:hypothetical protein